MSSTTKSRKSRSDSDLRFGEQLRVDPSPRRVLPKSGRKGLQAETMDSSVDEFDEHDVEELETDSYSENSDEEEETGQAQASRLVTASRTTSTKRIRKSHVQNESEDLEYEENRRYMTVEPRKGAKNESPLRSPKGPSTRRNSFPSTDNSHLVAGNITIRKTVRMERQKECDNLQSDSSTFWKAISAFLMAIIIIGFVSTQSSIANTSEHCSLLQQQPIQALQSELTSLATFSPSFDSTRFISLFQHRVSGKPTVVHLASTLSSRLRTVVSWLRQKEPCSSGASLLASSGNFVDQAGALAMNSESSNSNRGSCKVLVAIELQNSDFPKKNRDWLESVVDDTFPFAYTEQGSVDTSDWCVILEDHWTEEYAQNLKSGDPNASSPIAQRIRDITVPKWTGRFYQRVRGVFYV